MFVLAWTFGFFNVDIEVSHNNELIILFASFIYKIFQFFEKGVYVW